MRVSLEKAKMYGVNLKKYQEAIDWANSRPKIELDNKVKFKEIDIWIYTKSEQR